MATSISKDPLKGFNDYYPQDYLRREVIINIMHKLSRSFGYLPYDGPTLESTSLYEAKSGDNIAREESYTFKDRGERRVSLRPEMTPTLARMVARRSSDFKKPIRLYSTPLIFRNENPQKGRSRESMQYNVDILGENSVMAEIEIIYICMSLLKNLGFSFDDFEIRVSDRTYTENMIGSLTTDSKALFALIDRYLKMPLSEFKDSLMKLLVRGEDIDKVLDFLEKRDYTQSEKLQDLFENAKLYNLNLVYDPTIVRGFDYYSGIVFEIWEKSGKFKRSVFGGGRYQDLVSLFGGEKIEGVGAAISDTVILALCQDLEKKIDVDIKFDYFISTFENVPKDVYIKIAENLRNKDYTVISNINYDWNLTKQLTFALGMNVLNFVILGSKEMEDGMVTIKDLSKNIETKIKFEDFLK